MAALCGLVLATSQQSLMTSGRASIRSGGGIANPPIGQAVRENGGGDHNTVCRQKILKWGSTIERLKEHFPHFDDVAAT